MFIHLNCHSNYSLMAGADRIDGLVESACRSGFPALAVTDINGLYGAVRFYQSARSAGIRPIFGAEIDSAPHPGKTLPRAIDRPEPHGPGRAVLLAKDMAGFAEICRVITDRHLQPDFDLAQRLRRCGDRIIILCPDEHIIEKIVHERGDRDIYVELNRFGKCRNRSLRLMAFARRHRLPCAASNRVFFAHPQGWKVHRLLAAMRTGTTVTSLPPGTVAHPQCWMKSADIMARLFHDAPEAVRNTRIIAEQCDAALSIGKIRFPPFHLPHGETNSTFLRKLAHTGANKLYRPMTATVLERLHYELKVIDNLGFAPYFLIVWDIVREARARDILTVGRGSAANSLVCTALGITEVDPIRYNLYFERFLNPERADYPDIDIDFPWNRRDEMLDYVFEKYGRDNVALISAHVHFRGRSTIREVGKAIGAPLVEIESFTKRLPHSAELSGLEQVRETIPECRDLPLEDEPYRSIIALSQKVEGFPRHLSIHCGGIVVSPFPITDLIPLQKTPKGFVVTQYDMYPVEDMGLLKIDLLAQKGLAVLADTVADVRKHRGIEIDFTRVDPIQDARTKAVVREGKTIGCFYIESPGMRNLLQKLGVETFEMLTAASSIIRPGVADSGMMRAFIERHNGREAVHYLHPKMQAILKDTFGVMIYQEDVIKVAHAIAGMSLGEADHLRKCMSKKRNWEDIENYRERFLSGAVDNGVSLGVANEIWRQIESFAGYAFCKAHSASFAVVSYQTAYLKVHYPAEFMAAVLSNRGGFYDTCAYLEEARRMGLRILPPDIHHSHYEFTAEPLACESGRRAAAVRVGLMQVKRLSHRTIDSILADREQCGPYPSLEHFLSRVDIDDHEVEALIRCGAFDSLGPSRPQLLWQSRLLRRARREKHPSTRSAELFVESGRFGSAPSLSLIPSLPEYDLREKLWAELENLDLTASSHLLSLFGMDADGKICDPSFAVRSVAGPADVHRRQARWAKSVIPAREINRRAGRLVTLVGWLISAKRTRTGKNEIMKFLTLEDPTAAFDVTLFPGVYRRFGSLLYDRGPYIVKGKVERDGLCHTVTALWLGRAGYARR